VCIKLVDNLSRYRVTALRPRTSKVKACQAHSSIATNENGRRGERSVYDLMSVSMRKRSEDITDNTELLAD